MNILKIYNLVNIDTSQKSVGGTLERRIEWFEFKQKNNPDEDMFVVWSASHSLGFKYIYLCELLDNRI